MNEANDDDIMLPPRGAPSAFKTILFLPGAMPGMVVDGVPRSEGWVGQCEAVEADDLCCRHLAIEIPDDWALPPAADDEPLPNYIEHAVFRHPAVIALMRLGASVGLKAPIISPVRPGERTIQWWLHVNPPDHRYYWQANHARLTVLSHYRQYLFWRLMVQLFDQLRSGKQAVFGLLAGETDYNLQPVPHGLWRHPDMVLNYHPRGDWLRPEQQLGWPAPAVGLPAFGELILRDVTASPVSPVPEPGQEQIPNKSPSRQNLVADALVSLHRDQVLNIHSRAVNARTLYNMALERTDDKVGQRTFERALKDARRRTSG